VLEASLDQRIGGSSVLRLFNTGPLSRVLFSAQQQRHCELLLVRWARLTSQSILVGNLRQNQSRLKKAQYFEQPMSDLIESCQLIDQAHWCLLFSVCQVGKQGGGGAGACRRVTAAAREFDCLS
jgi:hypothetical protein